MANRLGLTSESAAGRLAAVVPVSGSEPRWKAAVESLTEPLVLVEQAVLEAADVSQDFAERASRLAEETSP